MSTRGLVSLLLCFVLFVFFVVVCVDTEISEDELMAAVDLGSNSFHLVVARYEHGEPRVIDRLRDSVRLAAGLRPDGSLEESRRQRALECLARFGQRLRTLPPHRVRAVATI